MSISAANFKSLYTVGGVVETRNVYTTKISKSIKGHNSANSK